MASHGWNGYINNVLAAIALLCAVHDPACETLRTTPVVFQPMPAGVGAMTPLDARRVLLNPVRAFDDYTLALVLAHEAQHVRDFRDGLNPSATCLIESRGLSAQVQAFEALRSAGVEEPQPPSMDAGATAYLAYFAPGHQTDLARFSAQYPACHAPPPAQA